MKAEFVLRVSEIVLELTLESETERTALAKMLDQSFHVWNNQKVPSTVFYKYESDQLGKVGVQVPMSELERRLRCADAEKRRESGEEGIEWIPVKKSEFAQTEAGEPCQN